MVDTTLIGYIYGLYSTSDNLIRYIGYSHSPYIRHKSHLKESKLLKYRRHKWIQSELSKGFMINTEILRCVPLSQISNAEIETILLYKSFGADLVNGNNGGRGGISPTKEIREKLRISKLGNKYSCGTIRSKEHREAISKRMKGRIVNPKSIEKLKQSMLGKPARNRIFNEEQVINIFKLYNEGKTSIEISNIYNINYKTINTLIYTSTYSEIKLKHNLIKIDRKENGFIKYNKLKKLNTIVKIKKEYVKKVRISGRHYKLTNKDVLFIKNNLLLTQKELSLRFNVSSRTIRRVLNK